MTSREFLIYVTVILAVMAVAALIETAVPMFAAHGREDGLQAANLGLTALSFVSKWLLASAAALAAVTLRAEGLLARADWSVWVQVGVGIVVLDFSVGYLSHNDAHVARHVALPPDPPQRHVRGRDHYLPDTSGRNGLAVPVRHRPPCGRLACPRRLV